MDNKIRDNRNGPEIFHVGEVYYMQDQAYLDYCPLEASYLDSTTDSAYFAYAVNTQGTKAIELRWEIINHETEDESMACDWDNFTVINEFNI